MKKFTEILSIIPYAFFGICIGICFRASVESNKAKNNVTESYTMESSESTSGGRYEVYTTTSQKDYLNYLKNLDGDDYEILYTTEKDNNFIIVYSNKK